MGVIILTTCYMVGEIGARIMAISIMVTVTKVITTTVLAPLVRLFMAVGVIVIVMVVHMILMNALKLFNLHRDVDFHFIISLMYFWTCS